MRISDWSSDVCSSDLAVDRFDGREYDAGLHRHWLDPARPVAAAVYAQAQGVLVTSATLRNGGGGDSDWHDADIRTGARHIEGAVDRKSTRRTPGPNDHIVCSLLPEKKKKHNISLRN